MRFYGFGNYYLSQIQQGIQAAHTVAELFVQPKDTSMVVEWAKRHKTMVLLNGGNSSALHEIYTQLVTLKKKGMKLPFAKFNEDDASLGGALTYVGMIVPENYYELASKARNNDGRWDEELFKLKTWERSLIELLNKYPLAR